MTFTIPETIPQQPAGSSNNTLQPKPARLDPDAYRAELVNRLADAEKEQAHDQKALAAAEAKVADLKRDVEFDGWKVGSRGKEVAEFDRLRAKAAK